MLKLLNGFDIRSASPVDKRLIKSKEEMRSTQSGSIPQYYFCVCSDDGDFYLYNANNPNSPETGKYKKLEVSGHEPTIYYFSPDPDATEEEIEEEIATLVSTLKPGDAIVSKEGDSEVTYKAFPNGKWDPISDQPLFGATSNVYRYDVYASGDENVSSKVQVVGSVVVALSPEQADEFFNLRSGLLGYATCDPSGNGKLIPSLKTVMVTDLKPGYESFEDAIKASVPKASLTSGKEWILSFDTII